MPTQYCRSCDQEMLLEDGRSTGKVEVRFPVRCLGCGKTGGLVREL